MFENLDPARQLDRAVAVFDRSLAAPFYRTKYDGLGRPDGPVAWERVPVLKRPELFENAYPRTRDMLTVPEEGFFISATSGTSGTARYVVCTHPEWDAFCAEQAKALRLMGVVPADRVANIFEAGYLWPSFLAVHDIVKKLNATHLPITSIIPPERILKYCREFQPTVMLSIPTMLVFLADLALKEGVTFPAMRLVGYAGEAMTPAMKEHVMKGLGAREVRAMAYSSADAGLMGYQCELSAGTVYHVPTAFQLMEIVDADARAVPRGEAGDLLVTNFAQLSMPIVRYEIGDRGRWVEGSCPCGDPNPRLELMGRIGADDFKLFATIIPMSVFETALAPFPAQLGLNFTLHVSEAAGQKVAMELRVESGRPEAAAAAAAEVRQRILDLDVVIRASVERGLVTSLAVVPVPLGTLPRNPSTGKLKRLEDTRGH